MGKYEQVRNKEGLAGQGSIGSSGYHVEKSASYLVKLKMSDESRKASLLIRVFAKLLDFILIAAMAEVVLKAGFYAGLSYLLISDGLFKGQSIGKRLMNLKAVSAETGVPCSMKESILRNAPLAAGLLLYKLPLVGWIFIGLVSVLEFLVMLGSKEGMRLGDELAKTVVIEVIEKATNKDNPGQEA